MTKAPSPADPTAADGAARAAWTCPTCSVQSTSDYCGGCGERRLRPGDLTLTALLGQAIESIIDVDGRVFRTFLTLIAKPGELTVAYLRGERKRYVGPVQLFLIANVVFFFVQALLGFQSLSNNLSSHLENQRYSNWVRPWAEQVLEARGTTRAEYEPVFDSAVVVNAKALAVLMVPLFALLAWLLSPLRGRAAVAHLAFGFHFEAFYLLMLCAVFPLIAVPIAFFLWFFGLPDSYADVIVAWAAVIPLCFWYTYVAFGRVYGGPPWARALKAAAFSMLGLIAVIRVYRLIVFLVTFYTA